MVGKGLNRTDIKPNNWLLVCLCIVVVRFTLEYLRVYLVSIGVGGSRYVPGGEGGGPAVGTVTPGFSSGGGGADPFTGEWMH